jgi:hypothetical protein
LSPFALDDCAQSAHEIAARCAALGKALVARGPYFLRVCDSAQTFCRGKKILLRKAEAPNNCLRPVEEIHHE